MRQEGPGHPYHGVWELVMTSLVRAGGSRSHRKEEVTRVKEQQRKLGRTFYIPRVALFF